MKDIPQNNLERSNDTISKVADMLVLSGDDSSATVVLLGDIAVSLAVIADTLIETLNKGGESK